MPDVLYRSERRLTVVRLTFLGIGSNSFSRLNTAAFVVEVSDGSWLLVDCGPDTPRQVVSAGIAHIDVQFIVITHRHLDHVLGLPYLWFGRNLDALALRRRSPDAFIKPLVVICESDVWQTMRALFNRCHPDIPSLAYGLHHIDIATLVHAPMDVGNLQIRTIPVNHTVPAFGIVARRNGAVVLAYSSDTLPSEDFIAAAAGAGTVIHEAMVPSSEGTFSSSAHHSTATQAGTVIGNIHPHQGFLIHLRPQFWPARVELEREASKAAGASVRFPAEGESIAI
jgi:ribonuclease BN (tRNA processing enzyme)